MKKRLTRFMRDEDGATLVEYGIALFIAILVGGTLLTGLASTVGDQFTEADTRISAEQTEAGYGGTD